MDLNYTVRKYNKYGEELDDGIHLTINDSFSIRFEDPVEMLCFGERIVRMCDEVTEAWNTPDDEE